MGLDSRHKDDNGTVRVSALGSANECDGGTAIWSADLKSEDVKYNPQPGGNKLAL